MKSFEGYLKQTAGDISVLLAGGGIKPLSDFLTTNSLSNYNPTNNFKTINGNSIIGTGDISISGTNGNYVLKTGDTTSGPITYVGGGGGFRQVTTSNTMVMNIGSGSSSSAIAGYEYGILQLFHNGTEVHRLYSHPSERSWVCVGSANFGIGTASPSLKLDVNGNIGITGDINFAGYGAICRSRTTSWATGRNLPGLLDPDGSIGIFSRASGSDDGGIIISPDTCVVFNSHDTGWGFAVYDKDLGADLTNEGTRSFGVNQSHQAWSLAGYINGSDERLKFNIKEINDESLLPLKKFNRKSDGVLTYGFIALELEAIGHNELVVDGTYKSVDYNSALSLCIAQLSNIVKRNNININDRINMLEKRIHNLETPPPLLIIKQRKEIYYEAA